MVVVGAAEVTSQNTQKHSHHRSSTTGSSSSSNQPTFRSSTATTSPVAKLLSQNRTGSIVQSSVTKVGAITFDRNRHHQIVCSDDLLDHHSHSRNPVANKLSISQEKLKNPIGTDEDDTADHDRDSSAGFQQLKKSLRQRLNEQQRVEEDDNHESRPTDPENDDNQKGKKKKGKIRKLNKSKGKGRAKGLLKGDNPDGDREPDDDGTVDELKNKGTIRDDVEDDSIVLRGSPSKHSSSPSSIPNSAIESMFLNSSSTSGSENRRPSPTLLSPPLTATSTVRPYSPLEIIDPTHSNKSYKNSNNSPHHYRMSGLSKQTSDEILLLTQSVKNTIRPEPDRTSERLVDRFVRQLPPSSSSTTSTIKAKNLSALAGSRRGSVLPELRVPILGMKLRPPTRFNRLIDSLYHQQDRNREAQNLIRIWRPVYDLLFRLPLLALTMVLLRDGELKQKAMKWIDEFFINLLSGSFFFKPFGCLGEEVDSRVLHKRFKVLVKEGCENDEEAVRISITLKTFIWVEINLIFCIVWLLVHKANSLL
ncbi:hypothetical protein BY996DRAFT_6852925, partial [Phakopsora pachyrhizi]